MSIKRLLGVTAMAMVMAVGITGCGRTGDGNFSVVKGWDGKYKDRIDGPGIDIYVIEDQFEIYGKNQAISMKLRPKDKDGVRLDELVVNVTYRALSEGALNYLRKDGDLVPRKDDSDSYSLGGDRLRIDLEPSVQQASDKWGAEDMFRKNEEFALMVKTEMQTDIDKKYGKGVFQIVDIKIPMVDLPEHIENKIAQIQIQKAEEAQNIARLAALSSRKTVEDKENELLRDGIKNSGLTNDQYIAYRWQNTVANMQSGNGIRSDKSEKGASSDSTTMMVVNINANK